MLGAKLLKASPSARRRRSRPADPTAVLAAARDLRAALVRPGDREVPRARHARQPARVQRDRHAADPQLPGRHVRRGAARSPPRTWPRRAASPATAAPRARSAASTSTRAPAASRSRVEYENVFALGPLCGVSDPDAVLEASGRCDDLGLDTISAGGTIAWAMECAERGLIDAPWLRFGDADALLRAHRRDRRARGPRRAAGRGLARRRRAVVGQGVRGVRAARRRAWSCRATSRARCRRWRSAWRSTRAAPTTTAPAPTRPTCPAAHDRLERRRAARRGRDRDRGPRRGHGLADPLQVPARRLRGPVPASGRALLRQRHRLGRRRRRARGDRAPDRARQARVQRARGLDARRRRPARALPHRAARGRLRTQPPRSRASGSTR